MTATPKGCYNYVPCLEWPLVRRTSKLLTELKMVLGNGISTKMPPLAGLVGGDILRPEFRRKDRALHRCITKMELAEPGLNVVLATKNAENTEIFPQPG